MMKLKSNINKLNFENVQVWLWEILLFLMLFIPRDLQEVKFVLLFVMSIMALWNIRSTGKIKLRKETLKVITIYLCYALVSSLIGFIRGNPGVIGFFRINVIYYVLFTLLITLISDDNKFQRIIRIIVIGGITISIYSIFLLMVSMGIWPESLFLRMDVTSNVGIHEGYTHLVNTNLSMMIFIAPFITMLISGKYSSKYISKTLLISTEILIIIAVLLSGRRILWITVLIPIIILILQYFINLLRKLKNFKISRENIKSVVTPKKVAAGIVVSILLVVFFYVMNKFSILSIEGIATRFLNAFRGQEGDIRIDQGKALWRGFLKFPLLGSGAGVGVSDYIRSTETWMYELSYHLILYNSGILGMGVYLASFFLILKNLWRKSIQSKSTVVANALIVAFLSALIANASNPYFTSSFDFIWFIFIPIMFINIPDENKNQANI